MTHKHLPEFATTINNLTAYLLSAYRHHKDYILGRPSGNLADMRQLNKIRMTQNHAAALLACTLNVEEDEFQWAADWFATPFPRVNFDVINTIEMHRLEGLLNLRPDDPTVQPRLQQLVRQRTGAYFEVAPDEDQTKNDPIFNALWALKVLIVARTKGVLGKIISETDLRNSLDEITEAARYDKDFALAIRLQYELRGKLIHKWETKLDERLQRAERQAHVWGVENEDRMERMREIIEAMHRQRLTPSIIDNHRTAFRDMILNTCYVIENLAPLRDRYPKISEPLDHSLRLWWSQFKGENAPREIRTLFETEYDYLMVLCRTMVAVGAYVEVPLGALCWSSAIREKANGFAASKLEEAENIEHTLRKWVGVELEEHEKLKLGLSGANVVRIKPRLYNPTDERHTDLLNTSLIVKYGLGDEIQKERQNYDQLPESIKKHFVHIPPTIHEDERRIAFVIMEDLIGYKTFYETYKTLLRPEKPRFISHLIEVLLSVHRSDGDKVIMANSNYVREIYMLPMLQHVDFIAQHVQSDALPSDEYAEQFTPIERELNTYLGGIMGSQHKLSAFPTAYMHGDLHTRNIMVRFVEKPDLSINKINYDIKLIDLESLRADGDAAHDAGQLVVDLGILLGLANKNSHTRLVQNNLVEMQRQIAQSYAAFAAERGDDTFELRFHLAKARALIRVAKGRAKRNELYLQDRDTRSAHEALNEILRYTTESLTYLRIAYNALC